VNVQVNTVSPTRKTLVIALDAGEVESEHQAVLTEFTRQARLPGFRPGKAPPAMIAKRFAKEIGEEFKQKVVSRAYRSALEKEKLSIINIVNVEEGTPAPGQPAEVKVTVDIRPDFTLPDLSGFSAEVDPAEAADAEVDATIESLRSDRSDFKATDRPAQKGDYVKLAYEGTLDGKPVTELLPDKQLYGKVPQTWEEVEGTQEGHLPGLGQQLAGLKAGEKKQVRISFPAEFPAAPALAGKGVDYDIEVQEVRERVLPALDETFLKALGASDLESLRTQVKANLKTQKEQRNAASIRRQVTDALAAAVDFPVPESLVEAETQGVLRNFIEENMRRGVPAEQFEKDKKELYTGAKQAAHRRVKLQLILSRIAEQEKIQVTEQDLDGQIYREAVRSGQRPEKLAKDLAKDRERLRALQENIIFDKAVDFLVSKAKISLRPTAASQTHP
jgi:trigger factor